MKNINSDLLKKYMRNECTPEEVDIIKEFIRHPGYKKELSDLIDHDWSDFNPHYIDEQVKAEMKNTYKKLSTPTRPSKKAIYIAIAAACIIPILLFTVHKTYDSKSGILSAHQQIITIYNLEKTKSVLLPDSSIIILGPDSYLLYPETFGTDKRTISLIGEAFFDVRKNPQKPFIVNTGEINTTVLGTSFKIDSRANQPIVISVVTGRVKVSEEEADKEEVLGILLPGKQLHYSPTANVQINDFDIEDIGAWRKGILSYHDTPFRLVLNNLSDWYDTDIKLASPELGEKKINLTIDGNEPIEKTLNLICQMTGLNYHLNNKKIIMDYEK